MGSCTCSLWPHILTGSGCEMGVMMCRNAYAQVVDDWGYVAVVIDRVQLYVFLVVTVLGSAALLTNAPHIFELVDQDEIKRRLTSHN